jgi:hypothetical protein
MAKASNENIYVRVVSFIASLFVLICSLRLSASLLAAWILSDTSLEADMLLNNLTTIHYKDK